MLIHMCTAACKKGTFCNCNYESITIFSSKLQCVVHKTTMCSTQNYDAKYTKLHKLQWEATYYVCT